MASLTNYKGLQIVSPDPTGAGGLAIQDDFKDLVDWHPKSVWSQSSDPGAGDDEGDEFYPGSFWLNTGGAVPRLFVCQSSASGSAVWRQVLFEVSQDSSPQLGGDLDVNGRKIVSSGNINVEIAPNGTGNTVVTNGDVGIGTSTPNDGGYNDGTLTVYNENSYGATELSTNRADAEDVSCGVQAWTYLRNTNDVPSRQVAKIDVETEGSTANDRGGRMKLYTREDGAGAAGATERVRIDSNGNVGINATSFGTSAAGVLALKNGNPPDDGPADTLQIYSKDLSAGNTMLGLQTEGTPVGDGTPSQNTTIAVEINGTTYYLLAATSPS